MMNADTLRELAAICDYGLYHLEEVALCFEGERLGVFRPEDDWWNYFPATP